MRGTCPTCGQQTSDGSGLAWLLVLIGAGGALGTLVGVVFYASTWYPLALFVPIAAIGAWVLWLLRDPPS